MRTDREETLLEAVSVRARYRRTPENQPFSFTTSDEYAVNRFFDRTLKFTCWGTDSACSGGLTEYANHLWRVSHTLDNSERPGYHKVPIHMRGSRNIALSTLLLLTLEGSGKALNILVWSGPVRVTTHAHLRSWETVLGTHCVPHSITRRQSYLLESVADDFYNVMHLQRQFKAGNVALESVSSAITGRN